LVAAAFTHRDSRAGDPDLHTHVAVANKVQTLAGRWLSIDGRVLHSAKVAASETYNTSLEYHLTASLGVRFAERPGGTGRSGRSGRSSEWIRGLPAAGRPGVRSSTSAEAWRERAADRVVAALEEHRATWQYWHLWAETQRQPRGAAIDPADTTHVTAAVVDKAITRSIRLTRRGVQVPLWSGDHP
jgi:hypothetical protein